MLSHMTQLHRKIAPTLAALACLCLNACAAKDISVTEVMNHSLCNNLTVGVQRITYADLARVRGAQLLTPPGTEPSAPEPEMLLIAVFNGEQPTPGYGFELQKASAHTDQVVLTYRWLSPSPDAVMAQMITSPCSVVELNFITMSNK